MQALIRDVSLIYSPHKGHFAIPIFIGERNSGNQRLNLEGREGMAHAPSAVAPMRHPRTLMAQFLDHVALEGRAGVAVSALFVAVDPQHDRCLRRHMWQLLKRQQMRGVLQFVYRPTALLASSPVVQPENADAVPLAARLGADTVDGVRKRIQQSSSSVVGSPTLLLGKKRKRPTSSPHMNGNLSKRDLEMEERSVPTPMPREQVNGSVDVVAPADDARTIDSYNIHNDASPATLAPPGQEPSKPEPTHDVVISECETAAPDPTVPMEVLDAMTLDDALGPHGEGALTLVVIASQELRFRALNAPFQAILADLGDEHLQILEAVGRARTRGMSTTELVALFADGTVKRLHNALDTLLSYHLVVKRMMIVARPAMRRMNIIHLPRFALEFTPHMFNASAEFESDDACKKILCAAAEAYLQKLPSRSCVLTDLGRDLNLHKRQLEILRSHILQEVKKDDAYRLELFQAVLRSTKKAAMEPKILNCIRYKPTAASAMAGGTIEPQAQQGITMEVGLLQQIYTLIEDAGDHGATIVEMRNQIVLPGSKLPYKLVSMLAGTYGLRAETIILGKNKAFRLFANPDVKNATNALLEPSLELPENGNNDTNSSVIMDEAHGTGTPHKDKGQQQDKDTPQTLRASTTLKGAFGGGVEVRGTRARRRKHILERLALEKIISISSLRASVFGMEKQVAAAAESIDAQEQQQQPGAFVSVTSAAVAAVGMVDTRSISRIAEELEREGSLRLLQLPLPAKNVSTKFRALKCVVCPGYEQDEAFIQQFVKNYCRDERLRRVRQNTERNQVIRLRTLESDDESEAAKVSSSSAAGAAEVAVGNDGTPAKAGRGGNNQRRVKRRLDVDGSSAQDQSRHYSGSQDGEQPAPIEISYRIRRFVNQAKSGIHTHQYRTLGFAYGVMYRCKVFHKFLWAFLHDAKNNHAQLRDEATDLSIDDEEETSDMGDAPHRSSGIVFSREAVLHSMPVHLYIQVFSGGEILSPTELAIVEDAVANKRFFHDLPDALRDKIWSHESQRTAKVLGTLTDLELIHPHKIGMKSLIKILRAGYTDGRDGVLSRALKDNVLGGLFRLRSQTRIVLDDKNGDHVHFYPPGEQQAGGEPRKRVNELNELRLVGMTEKHYSFSNLLPLQFVLNTEADVDRYWEALECLCLEQMVMEVSNPKRNEPAVCEVPKPAKTRARRMLRILAWISKSRKPASKAAANGSSAEENGKTAASKRVEKRNGIVSKAYTPRLKRRQTHSTKDTTSGSAAVANTTDSEKADEEAYSKPHRAVQRRSTSVHAQASGTGSVENGDESKSNSLLWTEENERNLLSFFIENCKSRWKIAIPLGLQRESEQIAFRNPSISRTGFGLVTIARKLGKRRIDVKKRLKEKLTEPAAKLLFENAKRETTLREHPGGIFDEEVTILQSARLTALFRRAVMMVVSPQEEYHPLVAEELISFWTAQEIRLVWRYLWLKNWIVRATEKEKVRGYTTSQRLQDFLKLTTLSYPLWLFRQAAEQESMIHSTLEEITTSSSHSGVYGVVANSHHPKERGTDMPNSTDQLFEAEFPTNATPGQCALELACQVMGTCTLTATHCPHGDPSDDNDVSDNGHASDERSSQNKASSHKHNLRFLNYKSLKGSGSGFAAHLAKHVHFKKSSVLIDNWHVDTQLNAVTLEDKEQMRNLEAFSTAGNEDNDGLGTIAFLPFKKRRKSQDVLERAVMDYVQASGEAGITLAEVVHKLHNHHLSNDNNDNCVNDQDDEELRSVAAATVGRCLNTLVDNGALLCVNAYFDQRFIVKDHGDVWLLRPFSLVTNSGSTTGSATGTSNTSPNAVKSRVVFEGEKDTLSFPWLKMDGSTNYKFLFSIQRKLLSLILMAPGITEQSVYLRMDKLLTLQDTREALALLVEEGLVYVRGTTSGSTTSRLSLFSKSHKRRRADSEDAPVTSSTGGTRVVNLVGNVLNFDRETFVVHYFPHLECIQRFGSIVQDYQNEVTEFHRTP